MKLEKVISPISDFNLAWDSRRFVCGQDRQIETNYRFCIRHNDQTPETPSSVELNGTGITARFDGFKAAINYNIDAEGLYLDENISLTFDNSLVTLNDIAIGPQLDVSDLQGFTATPVPFKVGLDGKSKVIDLNDPQEGSYSAEGWVLDNGTDGYLVMRVPTGSALTCFVPLIIRKEGARILLQFGSIGPDGDNHQVRNSFLDTQWQEQTIELPTTRFVCFKGNWQTGYEIFRRMVEMSLTRSSEPKRGPLPITYNTYHDFGPSYDRARLVEIMPRLASMGIGLMHLDPGWETVWGSNVWKEDTMGPVEEFTREAEKHGLLVGNWTSVHTTDTQVHNDFYIRNSKGEKYLAEKFGEVELWGVCPDSGWREETLANLSKLGNAGFRFLNSDFHDWPWSAESCQSKEHYHDKPLTRVQWAESLNKLYEELHKACPNLVIEMHDHVESGDYRTPVWYMYDRPYSYDEKWAYEFMWTTHQDLLDRKLFSLYYMRLAEPIPFFLHMNASSDNSNAIAFWYVASCVTHIGVGAIMNSSEEQRQAYAKAFAAYNARSEAFTLGRFYGVDELTHVHVYPDKKRAVILAFNIEDEPIERSFAVDTEMWDMEQGRIKVEGAQLSDGLITVNIPPKDVVIIDVAVE